MSDAEKREYTEKQKEQRRKAVRNYENNNYRLNIVFPKGTKEQITATGAKSINGFIVEAVKEKLSK